MNERQVRQERTGFRDQALSQRHRMWGWDCPATDVDFLMVEFDEGRAKALVEYKHENAPCPSWESPTMRALADFASRGGIPFMVVRYGSDLSWFDVWPCNEHASRLVPGDCSGPIPEVEYVALLYRIRGRAMPLALRSRLNLLEQAS